MDYINATDIKNFQDYAVTKSGELCTVELLLRRIKTQKKGKKPTLYYKGMEVIPNITKSDIERILYCEHCGFQKVVNEDEWEEEIPCPTCGSIYAYGWEGYRLKGTQYQIYSNKEWDSFSNNFKSQFTELDRFKELK